MANHWQRRRRFVRGLVTIPLRTFRGRRRARRRIIVGVKKHDPLVALALSAAFALTVMIALALVIG